MNTQEDASHLSPRLERELDFFGPLRNKYCILFWMVIKQSDKEAIWNPDPLLVPAPPAKVTFMAGSVPSMMQEMPDRKW